MIIFSTHIRLDHLYIHDTMSEIKEKDYINLLCYTSCYINEIGNKKTIPYFIPYKYRSKIET